MVWSFGEFMLVGSVLMSCLVCGQVPVRIFITKQLPKTATGKIQRRMMVEHFIKGPGQKEEAGKGGSGKTPAQSHQSKL